MEKIIRNIPSAITILNLAAGFMAIILADFLYSTIFLLAALVFDVLDGLLARALNAQSELGVQLDSMADLVSFGLAPAYLYYKMAPSDEWYILYLPALIIGSASALRLAKFNLLPSSKDFIGLPTPSNAFFYLGLFLCSVGNNEWVLKLFQNPWIYIGIPILLSWAMHSKLKMFSLKSLSKDWMKNGYHAGLFIIFVVLVIIDQFSAFVCIIPAYILLSFFYGKTRSKMS